MTAALWAKVTAVAVAALLGGLTCNTVWRARWAERDAADAAARDVATRTTLSAEKHYLNQIATAQRDHVKTQSLLNAELTRAAAAAERLRDTGAAYLTAGATDTAAACRQRAATLWLLFEEADRAAGAMAQAADEHAADTATLMAAWPSNPITIQSLTHTE